MTVFYKRNKCPIAHYAGTSFVAKPIVGPEIPQGPFDKCADCPYPRHGFLCWGKDGSCLKTDMEKIYNKERLVQALC